MRDLSFDNTRYCGLNARVCKFDQMVGTTAGGNEPSIERIDQDHAHVRTKSGPRAFAVVIIVLALLAFSAHTEKIVLAEAMSSAGPLWRFASADCRGSTPPGHTRIFVADRTDGKIGSGLATDPFNGDTAQKFDSILRTRSEKGVTNLVVCIGPGTFQTEGTYDFLLGGGHLDKTNPAGFTVNRGWRVHGASMNTTILQLSDLYLNPSTPEYILGLIIGTYDLDSHGVEVSDLTLDDNYSALKARYKIDLQLQAVFLQSNQGGHWIHNVHVLNSAGEVTEDFPIEIGARSQNPRYSDGNIVEYVTLDHWFGGECTAIAIANASAEVRYNTVTGYWGGYGGWHMSNVNFHDNYAIQTFYGFNIDSLDNNGITISHNQIVHPRAYGVVIGGIGQFRNFSITNNTFTMASVGTGSTLVALILQSNVVGAKITDNKIISDQLPIPTNIYAVLEKGDRNTGNTFQSNQISDSFRISLKSAICAFGNTSQEGIPLQKLPNTQKTACVSDLEK